MKRILTFLVVTFAIGCGSNSPNPPSASAPTTASSPTAAAGKPDSDEAVASIRDYFSDPGIGFSNIEVEKLSEPVEVPPSAIPGWGETWVYSLTMNCNFVIGDKQQKKDWLVLIGRQNGKVTVKEHYHNLESMEKSPLGKEWFVQKGFPEPAVVND